MARGHDVHARAERRIRQDHTDTASAEFEHQLLSDGVWEDVLEDTQLAQLEDAIATAESARERRRGELDDESEDHGLLVATAMDDLQVATAMDNLQNVVRKRVMELCAERAHRALEDGDQWLAETHFSAELVEDAQDEAAGWLHEHPTVCLRVFGTTHPSVLTDHEVTA